MRNTLQVEGLAQVPLQKSHTSCRVTWWACVQVPPQSLGPLLHIPVYYFLNWLTSWLMDNTSIGPNKFSYHTFGIYSPMLLPKVLCASLVWESLNVIWVVLIPGVLTTVATTESQRWQYQDSKWILIPDGSLIRKSIWRWVFQAEGMTRANVLSWECAWWVQEAARWPRLGADLRERGRLADEAIYVLESQWCEIQETMILTFILSDLKVTQAFWELAEGGQPRREMMRAMWG